MYLYQRRASACTLLQSQLSPLQRRDDGGVRPQINREARKGSGFLRWEQALWASEPI